MMAEEGRRRKQHLLSALSHFSRWERNSGKGTEERHNKYHQRSLHLGPSSSSLMGTFSYSVLCKTKKNDTFILRLIDSTNWPPHHFSIPIKNPPFVNLSPNHIHTTSTSQHLQIELTSKQPQSRIFVIISTCGLRSHWTETPIPIPKSTQTLTFLIINLAQVETENQENRNPCRRPRRRRIEARRRWSVAAWRSRT